MNYIATIGEREVTVVVEELGGALYKVTVDGRQHMVNVCQVQSTLWSVLNGANSHEVDVKGRDEEYEVLIAGDCYRFTLMNEQRKVLLRVAGKVAAVKAMVTSLMPGKVVKVLVAEGEEVTANQGVIVVEAMKMENELRSAVSGRVKQIFVKEGEIVKTGTKLILVE